MPECLTEVLRCFAPEQASLTALHDPLPIRDALNKHLAPLLHIRQVEVAPLPGGHVQDAHRTGRA